LLVGYSKSRFAFLYFDQAGKVDNPILRHNLKEERRMLFHSSLGFHSNWSTEQLNPKAWLSLREKTSLLVSAAPTTLSATYSGNQVLNQFALQILK
jgi:hypothetical protein